MKMNNQLLMEAIAVGLVVVVLGSSCSLLYESNEIKDE